MTEEFISDPPLFCYELFFTEFSASVMFDRMMRGLLHRCLLLCFSERTVFVPPPEPTGLPEDVEYK